MKYVKTTPAKLALILVTAIALSVMSVAIAAVGLAYEAGFYRGKGLGGGPADNSTVYFLAKQVYELRELWVPIGFMAGFIALLGLILLVMAAGRRWDTDALCPGPLGRLPIDGTLALLSIWDGLLGAVTVFVLGNTLPPGILGLKTGAVYVVFAGLLIFSATILALLAWVVQLKEHTVIRRLLLVRAAKLFWRLLLIIWDLMKKMLSGFGRTAKNGAEGLLQRLSVLKRALVIFALFNFVKLIVYSTGDMEPILAAWFMGSLVELALLIILARQVQSLRDAGRALAAGDTGCQLDEDRLFGLLREHGRDLNHISDGIHQAVEEQLKSERMKTELITNVSHDLKTPLTSLINYADLLGREDSDNPRIREYAQVVLRQSDRLKRLIEDLVEASKASSGSLDVELMACDARNFLTQAAGEYEDRLEAARLKLVVKNAEKPVPIMADGRRMFRVFDNLMNNICKYAMPDTRVYLILEEQGDEAVISFKNISRAPLDMGPGELLQRFVRGDRARSTEGNGLGLSIAESLTLLQGGSLSLEIDGDLFKVVLKFERI